MHTGKEGQEVHQLPVRSKEEMGVLRVNEGPSAGVAPAPDPRDSEHRKQLRAAG